MKGFNTLCLNLHSNQKKCKALKVDHCEDSCPSLITSPGEYLVMLGDMLSYNERNNQSCADLQKQILEIRTKYKLYSDIEHYRVKEKGSMVGLSEVYWEDTHRGDRGGSSDKDANGATSIKQKMKDNRPQECKLNKATKQEIYDTTKEWEEENGKLDKLSRSLLSRNKVDSYTGEKL